MSPFAIGRALLIAIAFALGAQLLATGALWSVSRGGLAASGTVLGVIGGLSPLTAFALSWLLVALLWAYGLAVRRIPWDLITQGANVLSIALVVIVGARWLVGGGIDQLLRDLRTSQVGSAADIAATDAPDIYVVLLDGYARDDWLAEAFDFDNTPFLADLQAKGYDIYPNANSNYDSTALTLASMFNLDYLDELPELDRVRSGAAPLQPSLRNAIGSGRAFDVLRSSGYEIVSISAGWEELSLRNADVFRDVGHLNEFEQILLESTGLGRAIDEMDPDFFGRMIRERVESNLNALVEESATERERPRLVMVHVPSPHYPAVFNADGSPRRVGLRDLYRYAPPDGGEPAVTAAYSGQVQALNDMVLHTIDRLEPGNRPRLTMLFSDHGSLADVDGDAERMSTFLAAIAPQHPGLFGDNPSPVNLLRAIFTTYLGEDFAPLPVRTFRTSDLDRLSFREVIVEPRR